MDFVATAALIAVIWKAVDFLKALRNAEWNGVLTQLIVWVAAAGVMLLFRETQYAQEIAVGNGTLALMNTWDTLAVALAFGSAASATFDIKKSIDGTDSAKTSKFVGS